MAREDKICPGALNMAGPKSMTGPNSHVSRKLKVHLNCSKCQLPATWNNIYLGLVVWQHPPCNKVSEDQILP